MVRALDSWVTTSLIIRLCDGRAEGIKWEDCQGTPGLISETFFSYRLVKIFKLHCWGSRFEPHRSWSNCVLVPSAAGVDSNNYTRIWSSSFCFASGFFWGGEGDFSCQSKERQAIPTAGPGLPYLLNFDSSLWKITEVNNLKLNQTTSYTQNIFHITSDQNTP